MSDDRHLSPLDEERLHSRRVTDKIAVSGDDVQRDRRMRHAFTPDEHRLGTRLGGRRSGDQRRRLAAIRVAETLKPFLDVPQVRALDDSTRARLTVLLVRAWRRGYDTGSRSTRCRS